MMMSIHVSPEGNDSWDGSETHPFATLVRARDAARAVTGPRCIVVHGGEYYEVALELEPEDSGLTIEAAPGESPVLYGGRRITGWASDDEHCVVAALPGVQEGAWDFRLLLVNGRLCPRARLPREERFTHESVFNVRWMSTTAGGWERKPTPIELNTMRYAGDDLGRWLDVNNAELTIYHQWDESMVGLKALDEATRTVTFSTPAGHPPGAFAEWNPEAKTYMVWNVREGMTEPGQWYLDRTAGKVVYWPLPGEEMATAQVIAPTTEQIIHLHGGEGRPVTGITLRGLQLAATTTPLKAGGFGAGYFNGAVTVSYAEDCTLRDLLITRVGGQGVKIGKSRRVRIEGCEIAQTGACAITGNCAEVVFLNNHLHHIGLTYPSAITVNGAWDHGIISHNEMHDCPYCAIHSSGNGTRIEANLFYAVMQVLQDGAAVYVGFCKDVVICRNVARDVPGTLPNGAPRQAHAYYLDEQSDGCVVEDNLAVGQRWPLHNHMAHRCVIRHNVCIMPAGQSQLTFMKCTDFIMEGNIFVTDGDVVVRASPEALSATPNNIFSAQGQVRYESLVHDGYTGDGPVVFVPHDGTRLADPLFVDAARGDYRFAPASPARAMGLAPIDVSTAGRSQ